MTNCTRAGCVERRPAKATNRKSKRFTLLLALCGSCTCGPKQEEATPSVSPGVFYPISEGDRWRYTSAVGNATRVVTNVSDSDAIVTGEDRTAPLRIRIRDDAVVMLDIEGHEAGRLLDAPVERGHRWNYSLGDVQCEATYSNIATTFDVAGLHLEGCITVSRVCLHPEGQPFSAPTRETHEESYCPSLGRVEEELTLDPAPAGLSAGRHDRLVFYRVAGAPAPVIRPEGCDAFLLTPSDIQAACGPGFRAASLSDKNESAPTQNAHLAEGAPSGDAASCRLRFEYGDAWIEANLGRESTTEGAIAGLALNEGARSATLQMGGDRCSRERFELLGPLVQSLLRD